ncbi:glutathione S-transferase family protein [Pseudomaricurvus alkylphenolicus]|jgi:glutathione S-transferase|uniref:glutathione S-transferase family protein n=1 Tax=Pseudomaricurvus alkylphenolicus TaxID=1306991 RepID=UPI001421E9A3|nr:glutathione S-transferase family protein [Pseudomaricurvus alkylphenolicus]NIB38527.1 glutathione S-transferase family protein [Pseudomaricurvus alkylphenolicus]
MGIVTPTNKEVTAFRGLHLYHAALSNCSMRVRMVLEEKKLPWENHHLDITKKEHITPEYFGINPNGVVPTLVHDGVVIIESDDIIDHIDQSFPEPPLRPEHPEDLEKMYWWMHSAVEIHVKGVKTFIYYHKMQGKMRQTEEQKQAYEKLQTNQELIKFHQHSSEGFTEEEAIAAEKTLDRFFVEADSILENHQWLVGDRFTLADITWVPLHFTLAGAGYDFNRYPAVQAWADRIRERECFKKGVLEWCPKF